MLQLSSYFINKPVLSLRIGAPVAQAAQAIINPKNLKIEGFYCYNDTSKYPLILIGQDIRELSRQGFIVDDEDVLVNPEDLVRLQDILHIGYEVLKKSVETTSHERIGRVEDYAVDTTSMYIQKLYVSQPVWKNLAGGSLSVDRSQIVNVTDKKIVINDPLQPTPSVAPVAA